MFKKNVNLNSNNNIVTPINLDIPAFVMCPNWYAEFLPNNAWMEEYDKNITINVEKLLYQWFNIYNVLSGQSIVFLIPPKKGLPDEMWVNSFWVIPPKVTNNKPIAILSNYVAKGRAGEELEAKKLLEWLGYKTIKAPYKFEGWPQAKYLRDNIVFGGVGIRTELAFWKWVKSVLPSLEIIITELQDDEDKEYLYHEDCYIFPLDKENVLVYTKGLVQKTIKHIEKVANILDVTKDDCYQGICNSVRVGYLVLNASSLMYMKKSDPLYEAERKKNEKLEKYCRKLGLEVVFFNFSEALKQGALLSCAITPLNYVDYE